VGRVLTPVFKDRTKNGDFRVLALFAKRARGAMTDFIIRNRLEKPADLIHFTAGGYAYAAAESTEDKLVFLRDKR